jgi:hypothetical protein
MGEIRDLKCKCCKCWDSYEGCQAWDCDTDFAIVIEKVNKTAKEYGISVEAIMAMLALEENNKRYNESVSDDCILPDDFDPETDTQFLVSFANSTDLGKKRLVDMDTEDLKRLRAELDYVLETRGEDE